MYPLCEPFARHHDRVTVFVHPFHEPVQAERQQPRLPETVCIDRLRPQILCPNGHLRSEELFHQYASRSQCQRPSLKDEHPIEAPPDEKDDAYAPKYEGKIVQYLYEDTPLISLQHEETVNFYRVEESSLVNPVLVSLVHFAVRVRGSTSQHLEIVPVLLPLPGQVVYQEILRMEHLGQHQHFFLPFFFHRSQYWRYMSLCACIQAYKSFSISRYPGTS